MFNGKVIIITGGSSGIGKALAFELGRMGGSIVITGRREKELFDVAHALQMEKIKVLALVSDVSIQSSTNEVVQLTLEKFGRIDVLINNAGMSMRAMFDQVDIDATIRRLMDVNFWGTVYTTKAALPYIIERKGSIAGISSIVGNRGIPGRSAYSASKFAMQGWLEALRVEMFHHGVNVLWISPGFIATNIRSVALNAEGKPIGETPMDESKLMSPEECATHILTAIQKRKRSVVLTVTGKATVWVSKYLPGIADKYIHKFFFQEGKLIK